MIDLLKHLLKELESTKDSLIPIINVLYIRSKIKALKEAIEILEKGDKNEQ